MARSAGQLLADWKLQRLRQASHAFAYAVMVAITVTAVYAVHQLLEHRG
jgi:hypothetical protein